MKSRPALAPAILALLLLAGGVVARQPDEPATAPSSPPTTTSTPAPTPRDMLSPAVREMLDAPFLSPDEGRVLRLRHGVPIAGDIASGPAESWTDAKMVAARARLALTAGRWSDASLRDARADPLDRAEALLNTGDPAGALALLMPEDKPGVAPMGRAFNARAARLSYEAVRLATGLEPAKRELIVAQAKGVALALAQGALGDGAQAPDASASAAEIVEAVALAAQLVRDLGIEQVRGAGHESLMGHLARARQLDPTLWSVPAAEGELLLEKDNYAQARAALSESAKLNPSAAKVWLTGGLMAVASFDFPSAEQMAERLDRAAALVSIEPDGVRTDVEPPAPPSALGAVVRARALLRQDAPEAAAGLIDAQLEGLSSAPLLLSTRAAVLAGGYQFEELSAALDAFEARFNSSAQAAFTAGQTLADLRQYERASAVLARAQKLAPHWAQPVVELGLLEVQSGRNDEALAALTRAFELDPFNVRADNSLRLIRDLATFSTASSEHFVVRAKGPLDSALAREMLPVLEAIHLRVAGSGPGELNHTPARKTVIELMPNHATFAVRIAGLPRLHTIAASTGPVIAMEAPRDGRGHSGPYDWERVLQHEYVHTVGLSRTSNRMPHWFTEAQAVYLERRERDYPTVQLLARAFDEGELFDLDEISIAFTRPKRPTDRALAYAQGHWMYQFMSVTFGEQSPLRLMDRFAKGQRVAEAFEAELGVTPQEFMARFAPWAEAQLVAWGVRPPQGQPSAQSLLSEAPDAAQEPPPNPQANPQASEPTDARIDAALAAHPNHADVLEVALRRASEASASQPLPGGGTLSPRAIELAGRYAAARPVDPLPHRLLARHLLEVDPPAALTHLRWLDAREEREPTYAAQIATLLAQQGDLAGAAASAQRAVRISPYSGQLRELAATIAVQQRDLSTARAHLEFLALLEPQNAKHPARLEALKRLESQPPAKGQ